LGRWLPEAFAEDGQWVTVVPDRSVEAFQKGAASADLEPEAVGKRFNVDYVIVLDVHSLSLYQPHSMNMLYQGKVQLYLTWSDVRKHGGDPVYREAYTVSYPSEGEGPVDATDISPSQFRERFVKHIARELCGRFKARLRPRDETD